MNFETAAPVASKTTSPTLSDRLAFFNGVGPGFDHLRIGLSLSILLWHSFSNSYGLSYVASLPSFPIPPLLSSLLPMFFGLSGFLVMGSALRVGNVKTFLTYRSLRIAPALFTEIAVSALILGPILTTLPLKQYFLDPTFFEYFGSLIGRVRLTLPGVFTDNPTPEFVNLALWTVGPELLCYVAMTALMVTGYYKNRVALAAITIAYCAICLLSDNLSDGHVGEVLPPRILVFSFLFGAVLFAFRDRVVHSRSLAAISFVAATCLIFVGQQLDTIAPSYVAVPMYVYTIAVIGLTQLPEMPFFRRGDYSYGIYIYGFPIQQTVAYLLPSHREWWINFGISLPITLVIAAMSWHLIERPFLSLRKFFKSSDGAVVGPLFISCLSVYGFFLLYVTNVLPIELGIKLVLHQTGLRPLQ